MSNKFIKLNSPSVLGGKGPRFGRGEVFFGRRKVGISTRKVDVVVRRVRNRGTRGGRPVSGGGRFVVLRGGGGSFLGGASGRSFCGKGRLGSAREKWVLSFAG